MSRPILRRLTSSAALAALALGVLPATAASADPRDIEDFACPADQVPDPGVNDDDDDFHEHAIHCIVWYGLAQGTTASTYSPDRSVTRGQMATFIANLLTTGGVALPSDPEDAFEDDDGTEHEPRINALAELGVVEGTSETTYQPNAFVNRAQMASFLARAYAEITGEELPEGEDAFTDDEGNHHEDNINRVAAAGITAGTSETEYSPGLAVRRNQMASFLARELDLLVEEGEVTRPRPEGDNPTALDVPELLRVERASDTTVRFVFDEALNSTVSTGAFGLYSYDAERTAATSTSRFESATVLATFPAEAVAQATLGAVAAGAVQDADANTSPEGHAALQDVELPAGTTAAPDLVEVEVAENQGVFTFDEAAFNLEPEGYHLVLEDGTVVDSTAVSEGNGTTEHTVTFALTDAQADAVAYGYVDDGTVSDTEQDGAPGADGTLNVLQEAHVSDDGETNRPDLEDVTVVDETTVRYLFDGNVTVVTGSLIDQPGAFRVYFTDGSSAEAESAERRTENNAIYATFEEGVLDDFVSGGIVEANAASGANGTNRAQELGIELAFAAGDTAAPELESATVGQDGDTRFVRYVFDDAVAEVLDGSAFKVYAEDGSSDAFIAGTTPLSAGSCTIDAENAAVVECAVTAEDDEALHGFLAGAVVATVERDAVEGTDGHSNAEGAAILTGSVS